MKKVSCIKAENLQEIPVHIGQITIEKVDHLVLECPQCKTTFYIPLAAINTIMTFRKRQAGVV